MITSTGIFVYCLFSHGLADTHRHAERYLKTISYSPLITIEQPWHTIPFPTFTFDYPDARSGCKKIPKWRKTSLAQENEIDTLLKVFEKIEIYLHNQHGKNYKIVLYGVSRGASALLVFAALYPEKMKHVAALILESPFDSIGTIIDEIRNRFPLNGTISHNQAQTITELIFRKYSRSFPTPISLVELVPKNLPILIICSLKDRLVPAYSSQRLGEALRNSGNRHVEIVSLMNGGHGSLLFSDDGILYQDAVEQFYKKYLI